MGLVDKNNKVNFYDGDIRVVTPEGREFAKFRPGEYLDHIQRELSHGVTQIYLPEKSRMERVY